jgi:hypothetical protein
MPTRPNPPSMPPPVQGWEASHFEAVPHGFMNGTAERAGYNDGFMNYEALFEQIVNNLSSAFPSRGVPSLAPNPDCLIVALVCVKESSVGGTHKEVSMICYMF